MFHVDLELIPNFDSHPDGCMMAFNAWIASKNLNVRKISLTNEGELRQDQITSSVGAPYITPGSICILQLKTEFMVGQVDDSKLKVKVIMDPNPSIMNKDTPQCALFIYRSTTKYNKYYLSDQVEDAYVGKNDLKQYSFRKS